MRKEVDKYELIERYLQGELNGEQLDSFEQALQNDMEFANEVKQHKQLMSFVEEATLMDIRSQISEIHSKASAPTTKFQYKPWWGIPPAIVIIGGLLWFFTKPNATTIPLQKSSPSIVITDSNIIADTSNNEIVVDHVQKNVQKDEQNEAEVKIKKEVIAENIEKPVVEKEDIKILSEELLESEPLKPKAKILPEPVEKIEKDTVITKKTAITASALIADKKEKTKASIVDDEDVVDCREIEIYADVQLKPSCNNKPTGSIEIKKGSVIGGEAPFFYSLDNVNYKPIEFIYENLRSKLYKVYIKDKNDCVSFLRTHNLGWINCEYHDVFAPNRGELWKIPTNDYDGTLKVVSKNGS
ncbi:MAG: SprB repeat-containing protein, partial [Bacteroidales bacterium]|nr:SprB repeat-containing protein [Bacteroidales bacterium]